MTPTIQTLTPKILIGKRLTMSFADNKTTELWRSFMPRRREIVNTVGTDMFSMQVYPKGFFQNFDPAAEFDKWTAVEVTNFDAIPGEMEAVELPGGLYAVFHYAGAPENGAEVFRYILGEWLPSSGYTLDNRPHFEVLGDKYKNGDPASEEEIWIPITQQ